MHAPTAYAALLDELTHLEIIDSHEHLPSEKERLDQPVDFSTLFSQYCCGDLLAAGMPAAEMQKVFEPNTPLDEKWRLFAPFYARIQDGSYCRAAQIAMERFYGLSRLTSLADAEAVTQAIREANKPGLYRRVLKETCNIRRSIVYRNESREPEFFDFVHYIQHYAFPTKSLIRQLEDKFGSPCGSLDRYVDAVRQDIEEEDIKRGCKGFKLGLAYERDLNFAARTHAEAEQVFLRVMDESHGWRAAALGYEEMRPLQDYMVHRFFEIAGDYDVPVVIHSALQAGNEHNPDNARPLPLWNLAHRYPSVKLVILHAGLPWLDDAALLAKHYSNVYLDMAWDHLMSPELSTRALKAFIDLVPMNKVIGFGGDYLVVEKVYGHLVLARQNIARALAAKVDEGMPMERASGWIRAIMVDNPREIFALTD